MEKEHEIDYSKLIDNEAIIKFSGEYERLEEKNFTIKNANIKNWVVKNWQKEGLLIGDYEVEKWRKFDFIEIVWLRIIVKLRSFNVSLDNIRNLKENLFNIIPYDSYKENTDLIDILTKLNGGAISQVEMLKMLDSDDVKKIMKKFQKPMLFQFLLDSILFKNHFAVLLTEKGESMPYKESFREYLLAIPATSKIILGSHINISITQILVEFIQEHKVEVLSEQLRIISKEEGLILDYLRERGLKSMVIRLNEKEEISLLELEKNEPIENSKNLFELILKEGYQNINYTTVKGKIVNCVNTRKIKISSTE